MTCSPAAIPDASYGKVLLQRGHEGVAPFPVGALAAAQLPVVVAPFHEAGQERLVHDGVPQVHGALALDDLLGERRRYQQPAEPQPGRETC